jgi:predicted dehydrogenase
MPRPQRVAVIGVSHWHSTYGGVAYLKHLSALKLNIVGVSDQNAKIAEDRAKRFNSTPFNDYQAMVDKTKPEFVIALGKHIDMPAIFRFMVESRIPFAMEKPWGIDYATIENLVDLAESKKAWATVTLPGRFTFWAEEARRRLAAGEFGAISHVVARSNRGSLKRYPEMDSAWMLSRKEAGGGCLINLGCMPFDTCRFITGEELSVVASVMTNSVHKSEVEDFAEVTLRTPSNILCFTASGYTLPTDEHEGSDNDRKIVGEKMMMRAVKEGVHIWGHGRDEIVRAPAGYVGTHRRIIMECLDRIEKGQPPPITPRECLKVMRLVFDAYLLAGRA